MVSPPIRELWKYDHNVFNQSLFVWQTSGGESRDGVCPIRKRSVYLPYTQVAHVRVYDQFHPQAQTFTREIHDELGTRKFHHTTGGYQPRNPRDFTLHCVRLWSIHVGTRRTTPHVQTGQRLRGCVPMNIYIYNLLYGLFEVDWCCSVVSVIHTPYLIVTNILHDRFPNKECVPLHSLTLLTIPAKWTVIFCLWFHPIPKYSPFINLICIGNVYLMRWIIIINIIINFIIVIIILILSSCRWLV